MTFNIKSEKHGDLLVNLEVDKTGIYKAELLESRGCQWYTVKESMTPNRKNAMATYNRYRKQMISC